jgi:tRNA A37 threonylcarbamoyladenosine modification protein TsaB
LGRAGELLAAFARVLEEKKSSIEDVSGLGVIVGKGTFTATRVSTTLVNTLAFAHNIPVFTCKELPDPLHIKEQFALHQTGSYIQAQYSAEPRIHKKNPS